MFQEFYIVVQFFTFIMHYFVLKPQDYNIAFYIFKWMITVAEFIAWVRSRFLYIENTFDLVIINIIRMLLAFNSTGNIVENATK